MSFEFEINESDRVRADLIGAVGGDLQALFAQRKKEEGLTQQQVADALEVDKSRVHRCLTGHANLTLGTVADLARAIRGKVLIKIVPEEEVGRWAIHWSNPTQTGTQNRAADDNPQARSFAPRQAASGVWK